MTHKSRPKKEDIQCINVDYYIEIDPVNKRIDIYNREDFSGIHPAHPCISMFCSIVYDNRNYFKGEIVLFGTGPGGHDLTIELNENDYLRIYHKIKKHE